MKRSYISKLILALIFIVLCNNYEANAQLGNLTIEQCADEAAVLALIDTVFLEGVNPQQIKNITFTGDPGAVGYFKGGLIFGFQRAEGIIMSSGFAGDLDKPNNCTGFESGNTGGGSDPDLVTAGGTTINDACVIEFDFKPSGDSVKFNYIFGSEEYHEWVQPLFADVFGFFLSGPGIDGPYTNNGINIAEVPGTHNPVSIGTVNCGDQDSPCTEPPGGGPACEFLYDNTNQNQSSFNQCTMDAYTVPFKADNGVESCEWFHIKLAIGDAGDAAYDSGVFLEKGSFDPGNVEAETDFQHPIIKTVLYEKCNINEAVVYFTLGSVRSEPFTIPYVLLTDTIDGIAAAERGVDYQFFYGNSGQDSLLYIPEGQTYDSVRIIAFTDDIEEGIEHVSIRFNPAMCGFGVPDTNVVFISDTPDLIDTNFYFNSYCEQEIILGFGDDLGGVAPYTYDWYLEDKTTPTITVTPTGDNYFEYPCLVTDACERTVSDTATLVVPDLVASAGLDKSMCNQDSVTIDGSAPGAQQFLWSSNPADPSLLGKENQDTAWVYPVFNTDYYLTVSDNCTNDDQDTVHVSLNEAVANAGADQLICFNESATLTANGTDGFTWEWSAVPPDPTLSGQENLQEITISPTTTTTYSVTVTNDCGFAADDQAEVTVTPLPNADAGPNDAVCFGQEFQLNASGGTKYQWSSVPNDPSLFTNGQDTLPNPIVNPPTQEDYKYYVQVWDQCFNNDSMTLQVDPVPTLSVSADNEILCFGESVIITAVGNANYTWTADPADPTLSGQENNQTITVSPVVNTVYTLVGVVAGFNCPATIAQAIEVKPELMPTFDIQENEVCQGKNFSVMYTGNAAVSANYTWDFDGATVVNGSGGGPYDLSWDTEGPKTITLSVEEDGCFSEPGSMSLNVLRSPVADFTGDILEGCAPLTVDFSNNSTNISDSDVAYAWDFGDGETSNLADPPAHVYNTPGSYTITLTVTNDQKCMSTYTLTDYVKANEVPEADFEPVPPETVLEQPTISFANNSSSNESLVYNWNFGDSNTSTEQSPSHSYSAVGTYLVKLLVTTPSGCENEIEKEVIIHPDFAVHAPSAFSPNDDGLNDVFEVYGVGISKYLLQVYSRWGDLMYESRNLEDQWDGKYNGELVPAGTYVYTINYRSMLNKDYTKKGTVTVTR